MTEESAEVIDSLLEFALSGIGIADELEKQRVSASFTDVLIVVCAAVNGDVLMPPEKARELVSNTRRAGELIKNLRATANATSGRIFSDSRVVDLMSEQRAAG